MEILKEYFFSKYFSSFGYVVAALQVPALVTFAAVTGALKASERRTFRCDVSDCRDDCLGSYDEKYNSAFPLYGFVLSCFAPLVIVSIAYSWCFVKSRVDEIEAAMKSDPENPRRRPRVTTRRIFSSYFIHLLVRLVIGVVFAVLQNRVFFVSEVLYASEFPTDFVCLCSTTAVKPTANSTSFNATRVYPSNCDNSVGSDLATWAKGIWFVNILFASLVFVEICYLSVRALKSNAFTFDSEFCLNHFLGKSTTPVALPDFTFRLRTRVREDTEYLEPLIASGTQSDEDRALDDTFVDLIIYTGRAEHQFGSSLTRREIYDIYLKPQHGSIAIKTLDELFLPNADTQDPRKILIVGRPGIGKSLLCTKLWRNWSKNKMLCDSNKGFEHVFLFQFRWFNSGSTAEKKISLKQLLSRVCPDNQIDSDTFQFILDNPDRVLLMFDGLDEFKHHERCLEDERAEAGNGPTEEMQFSALYVKLVRSKQLAGATVLTTCRTTEVQSVEGLTFDRKVEIIGFTPDKVHEYVRKFFAHNTQTMDKIWLHISSNPELLSLCYIPVNSFIVCSLLEKWIALDEQDSESSLPKTTTEVYTGALRLFIFKHHPEFKGKTLTKRYLMGNTGSFSDSVEKMLSQLGSKAGIEARQLLFDSTQVQGMENCGLLNCLPDREVSPYNYTSHFCFLHLTLQELLAAREIAKMSPSDLSTFISTNASDPKWHLVIQFVAGLLRGQQNEAVNTFTSLLLDCLTTQLKFEDGRQKTLLMLKCLYEYNDETTVKEAASELELPMNHMFINDMNFSRCQVTPVECTAIVYFVKNLKMRTKLDLCLNSIGDQGVSHLCDALKNANCKLTKLDLSQNSITDQGVSHLCDALKNANCKLTKLDLWGNSITDQGVSHLCDALKNVNCKLTKLDLSGNSTTDQGVSHLCDALKNVNCKLTKLNLKYNSITDQGVSHLCDTLKTANCKLTKLDLSCINSITDQGVSHLCDALKNVNCKLTKLELSHNIITDQGVSHLCDALINVNCKLTQFNLNSNSITDQGVSHLCDALQNVNCKLTKLNLKYNSITDQGVSHLCDTLKTANCKLTKLDLSCINSITDQGVSHLCDALKNVNCKLTKLELSHNSITDQGVSHLGDALKNANCKLAQLDLWDDSVTDQGVSHLCDALKNVNCKLTKLELSHNSITDQGVSHLCDALINVNCKLTKLDLSQNSITDQGVSHLGDALKNANCKLAQLDLWDNSVTDQGVSHLCDALKNVNCKLTELDLGDNSITDQGKREVHESNAQRNAPCQLYL